MKRKGNSKAGIQKPVVNETKDVQSTDAEKVQEQEEQSTDTEKAQEQEEEQEEEQKSQPAEKIKVGVVNDRIRQTLKMYPQYEKLFIDSNGFVHPEDTPEYQRRGAILYKNEFYNK